MVRPLSDLTAFLDPTGEIRAELFPGRGISRAPVPLVGDDNATKRATAYLASMPAAASRPSRRQTVATLILAWADLR